MIFKVVPIRYDRGWRLTDTHRAEQWAVASFRRGFPMRIYIRCATKAKADGQLEGCQHAYEGLRVQRLGARMPARRHRRSGSKITGRFHHDKNGPNFTQ